jgi:cysteinyl-tRNA synthetase
MGGMKDQNTISIDSPVRIYNSLSGEKEIFRTRVAGKVNIYVCGMTVYDYCHLGHARVLVVFDSVVRYFRSLGVAVRYVRNITDIDDKIIARLQESDETFEDLTDRFIQAMHDDEQMLKILPPDEEPRATRFIDEIIDLIRRLEDSGYAYRGTNGDVYYRVRKFENYGQLSGNSLDQLELGARVEPDEASEDPLDFVLWKAWKPGEPYWESPWGQGRPGWHIECSAMSMKCLGESFDIHAGGKDLQFPHHENEIAQSEAATGTPFVKYWMHNGHVQVNREKMSKSLGNFFTIREILTRDSSPHRMGEIIRFMILSSHYRSPLSFSESSLNNAQAALTRLYLALDKVGPCIVENEMWQESDYWKSFHAAMADDFNTPIAIRVLFSLARVLNRTADSGQIESAREHRGQLIALAGVLGLLYQDPEMFLKGLSDLEASASVSKVESIEQHIHERSIAREQGNWKRADQIRVELSDQGVLLEDRSDGTTSWRLKRIYTSE